MNTLKVISLAIFVSSLPPLVHAGAIETFRKTCVAHAGDVTAIVAAGKRAGFSFTEFLEKGHLGVRKKTDETLQVNVATSHKFECAVTTSDMKNPAAVTEAFFKSLGLTPRGKSARGKLNGRTYTFLHDTNGGEAFVIYTD